uniref:ER membrane protein complex subunit 7 beta-sandwich domain-containing protein n=1 Tax=Daucus carota subsp. sativus TaxID=79200 RepID=A0A166GF60_DAUCS
MSKPFFHNVPAGTHLIEVAAVGYFFSPVRVDVSARNPGKVQAALTENRRGLSELVLEPLREEQYYEIREPFNVMSLVKSPMGLMVGFMLIVMFLMPKLVENMGSSDSKMGGTQTGVPDNMEVDKNAEGMSIGFTCNMNRIEEFLEGYFDNLEIQVQPLVRARLNRSWFS